MQTRNLLSFTAASAQVLIILQNKQTGKNQNLFGHVKKIDKIFVTRIVPLLLLFSVELIVYIKKINSRTQVSLLCPDISVGMIQ